MALTPLPILGDFLDISDLHSWHVLIRCVCECMCEEAQERGQQRILTALEKCFFFPVKLSFCPTHK